MRRDNAQSGSTPLTRWVPSVLLLGGTILAAHNLAEEWQVFSASRSVARGLGLTPSPPAAADIPPRAALAYALSAARQATEAGNKQGRTHNLLLAQDYLQRALSQRPRWGEADVAATFITFALDGAEAPATLAAYAHSYETARYIETSATWRIRYGMAAFPALSLDVRRAMLNEAAWVSTWSPRHFSLISSIAGPVHAADLREARLAYKRQAHID